MRQIGTQITEKDVIAPGEEVPSFTLAIHSEPTGEVVDSLRDLADAIDVAMCYCSVYGECWEYVEEAWPRRVAACAGVPGPPR